MKIRKSWGMILLVIACLVIGVANLNAQRQMEKLDRGLIAVRGNVSSVLVSWRLFGDDPDSIAFNLYRDGVKINSQPLNGATNYLDATAVNGTYTLFPVLNGLEQSLAATCLVWANNYKTIPISKPADGVNPLSESYTYIPNDVSAGDVDGDGQYEIIVKWDPSNAKDNSQSGFTGNVYLDAYEFDGTFLWRVDLGINIRAGAHYTQFMVYDLDGDGKAEVACKTAPGTRDGSGNYLSMGPAAADNDNADYRNSSGYILSGPEYLTIFNGLTGAEMVTVNYNPPRGTVSSWGDNYGNRVDRFLACVAYLDGKRPSLVMCRGYYTRTVLAAWDWRDGTLTQRWVFDSNNPGDGGYAGQGNHNLTVADADNDGKDEIIYGSCTIDDNGKGLYTTGLRHGDALHVSDLDPDRKGLEVFAPHESGNNGVTFRKAENGEIIWQKRNANDIGRGVAADITPDHKGMECWASSGLGVYDSHGDVFSGNFPSMNFAIWWDADVTRELLNGISIAKYNQGTIFNAVGCESNNGTKSTPALQADLFGDWREEAIWRTSDNNNLRIFTTLSSTDERIYTLMHDPQYRLAIAWQNVAYNQPPHTGYYLANGMRGVPPSALTGDKLVWNSGGSWDIGVASNWNKGNYPVAYSEGDDVLFDISGDNTNPVLISVPVSPASILVNSPIDYTFNGPGYISGTTGLKKAGSGTLTVNSVNDYTGTTVVWDGRLIVNGKITNSKVIAKSYAELAGKGSYEKGIDLEEHSILYVGGIGAADTLVIKDHLGCEENTILNFDLSDDPAGITKRNDLLIVDGDLNLSGSIIFKINLLNGDLVPGDYKLIQYNGAFSGNLDDIKVDGISGLGFRLQNSAGNIILEVMALRSASSISWVGGTVNNWDVAKQMNWDNNGTSDWFVPNDSVRFDDSGSPNTSVNIALEVQIGNMLVSSAIDYDFSGTGSISGTGGITKAGEGKLTLNTINKYTGPSRILGGSVEVPEIGLAGLPGAFGASSANAGNLVLDGGKILVQNLESATDRGISLGINGGTFDMLYTNSNLSLNGPLSGAGSLIKNGNGTLTLASLNNYSGGTIINGGTISLGSENANTGGLGTGPVTLKNATLSMLDNSSSYNDNCNWDIIVPGGYFGNLKLDSRSSLIGTLEGDGTLNLFTPFVRTDLLGDWSQFAGTINVSTDADGGTFVPGNAKGLGKATIHLDNNVTAFYRQTTNDTIEIGALSGDAGSVLGSGGEGSTTITWKIGTNNLNSVFNGVLNDVQYKNSGAEASVIKSGSGTLELTNANTYSGNTRVEEGILLASNLSGSATSSGDVTVATGGTLGGNGTINGNVIVNQGAVIAPGATDIAYLTINKNVTMDPGSYLSTKINTLDKLADILIVNGKLQLGGILYLSEISSGTFEAGDNYKILHSSACSGQFEEIIPTTPGNDLRWDTTGITVTGYLSVVKTTGINRNILKENIEVFPNPARDKLYITVDGVDFSKMGNSSAVRYYNSQGKLIDQKSLLSSGSQFRAEFDVSKLKPGIYVLEITGNNFNSTKKFVRK